MGWDGGWGGVVLCGEGKGEEEGGCRKCSVANLLFVTHRPCVSSLFEHMLCTLWIWMKGVNKDSYLILESLPAE